MLTKLKLTLMATSPKKTTSSKKTATPAPKKDMSMKSVATTIKAQGEMKQKMARPADKPKTFSKNAQEAGHRAAEDSRKKGKEMGALGRFEERAMQKILNFDTGIKALEGKAKRSKSGGVIDPMGRYSGLSNAQMNGRKKK